jgi:hypothetical protein
MEINVNGSGNNSSVKVFIIRILIAVVVGFCALAGSLGGYILKTFLPMYIEEMDIKKRELQPITATVLSVDREIKKDSVIGYMKLSYEYNGKDYVYDMKYYEEGSFHYSTNEDSNERRKRDDNDMRSKEHWEELQAMVGKEQEVFVDKNEPDKVFLPISEEFLKILKIIVSIGFALVAVVALIIVFVIILGKKIIGKFWQKRETTDSFIS